MEQKITKDNRYEHGKIYKLIDNTTGMFYIGSTALSRLDHRLRKHIERSKHDKYKNTKLYKQFTFDKLKSGEIKIIQLAEINVKNKRELEKLENEYIEKEINNVLCLNTHKSFLSYEDKVIRNFKYQEKYREENKDILREKHKEYRKQNHEHYLQYDRERLKNEERRQYNIEKSRKFRNKLYVCVCGSTFKMDAKSKHFKTKKHQQYMQQQESEAV